jgi:molecular chaperone GrpE
MTDAPQGDRAVADGGDPPVVRDKRRIDPETGQLRSEAAAEQGGAQPGAAASASASASADPGAAENPGAAADVSPDAALAAERLGDLQRLQAEYVNYRRRVERDRDVARDTAVAGVLDALLPVLDDVQLARQHGDLEGGPFAAIADKLDAVVARVGLVRFGEVGQAFDPAVHEALMHVEAELAAGTTATTVVQVLQPGYQVGDRVLRAARVAVADPTD